MSVGRSHTALGCYVGLLLVVVLLTIATFTTQNSTWVTSSSTHGKVPSKHSPTADVSETVAITNSSTTAEQDALVEPRNSSNAPVLYSRARTDRSGAAVLDMLMAHNYAFHQNFRYGGACVGPRNNRTERQNQHQQLIAAMQLTAVLPYQCPPGGIRDPSVMPFVKYSNFRSPGAFSSAWLDLVRSAVSYYYPSDRPAANVFQVAVHVRRGDITPCQHQDRYLPNSHYLELIEKYTPENHQKKRVGKAAVEVTIFSEKESFETLDEFRTRNYTVDIDSTEAEVWQRLYVADVVIMSKSSFSFVPSLLNRNGTIVYTSFGQGALPAWEIVDEDLVLRSTQEVERLLETRC